jgi:hypothetical protein
MQIEPFKLIFYGLQKYEKWNLRTNYNIMLHNAYNLF